MPTCSAVLVSLVLALAATSIAWAQGRDDCPRNAAQLAPLRTALERHPEGRLDVHAMRVTWPLPKGRSLAMERDTCDGATIVEVRSPQGFDIDWTKPDLAALVREYVSVAAGDELDARLRERRRWFQAPIDSPYTTLVTDPEPGPAFPAGVFVEQSPSRITVVWADHPDPGALDDIRDLRDEQQRIRDER